MIQGTTPTHTFNLPFDSANIECLRIVYEQNKKVILAKEECTKDGNKLELKLTQEETLMFDENIPVRIQLHVKFTNGEVGASKPTTVPVYELLDRREI